MRVAVRRTEGGGRDSAKRLRETYPVIAASRLSAETKRPHLYGFGVKRSQGAACEWCGVIGTFGLTCLVASWCLGALKHRPLHQKLCSAEFYCSLAMEKSLR